MGRLWNPSRGVPRFAPRGTWEAIYFNPMGGDNKSGEGGNPPPGAHIFGRFPWKERPPGGKKPGYKHRGVLPKRNAAYLSPKKWGPAKSIRRGTAGR